MSRIKIAVIGIGNCASALIQGLHYYTDKRSDDAIGLMHWDIGGYTPDKIQVAAAFDIDQRKVGHDVAEAIFAAPNCTATFCREIPPTGIRVHMGRILDGISEHMRQYEAHRTFLPADYVQPDKEKIVSILKESGVQVLLNYLPVGSEEATRF